VCVFIPKSERIDQLYIVNFVYETKLFEKGPLSVKPYFRVHFVTRGTGILHIPGKSYSLGEGDVFFTFPSVPYSLESGAEFKFYYISFMGKRANRLVDELGLGREKCVFTGLGNMGKLWSDVLNVSADAVELRGEGVLLYVLSEVKNQSPESAPVRSGDSSARRLKSYIDDRFADSELGLAKLSRELGYNPKYLSTLFKKTYGTGLSEYINTVRIRHACVLIEQGMTGVKDISTLCGFSDPMYFSRIFKQRLGVSPRGYIARHFEDDYYGK